MEEASVESRLAALEAAMEVEGQRFDVVFFLLAGVFIFLMQLGFAAVEVGTIRSKNVKAVLLKNVGDASIGALVWWIFGHGVAYGESSTSPSFIGRGGLFFSPNLGEGTDEDMALQYSQWFVEWAFAATSTTIVSGAIAERVTFQSYIVFGVVAIAIIYPAVAHWVWSSQGWASYLLEGNPLMGCGAIDFSGAGVVHATGGIAALVGAILIRPRAGRFDVRGQAVRMSQHNPALNTMGTLVLWAGWFLFNSAGVSSVSMQTAVAAKSMVNTAVCPAASAAAAVVILCLFETRVDSYAVNNTIISGLVAITAASPLVETEGAFMIGIMAAIIYYPCSKLLLRWQVDDVVEASVVHGVNGLWGVLAGGLFPTKELYGLVYDEGRATVCCGLFYGCGGRQLGAQVLFLLALIGWVGSTSLAVFMTIKWTLGLRVPDSVEEDGMDKTHHGSATGMSMIGSTLFNNGGLGRRGMIQQDPANVLFP